MSEIKETIKQLRLMKAQALEELKKAEESIHNAYDYQISLEYRNCKHEFNRWEPRISSNGSVSPMRECTKCGKVEFSTVKNYLTAAQDQIEKLEGKIKKYEQDL